MANEIITEAVQRAGGDSAVARKFGITKQAVQSWRKLGIPAVRVLKLSELSGIPPWEIAPEIYPPPSGDDRRVA